MEDAFELELADELDEYNLDIICSSILIMVKPELEIRVNTAPNATMPPRLAVRARSFSQIRSSRGEQSHPRGNGAALSKSRFRYPS